MIWEENNMKKRIISTLTAMLLTGMIFTACGSTAESGDASSAGSGDTVTLTVWGSQEGQPFLKRMCESFAAANPDKNYVFNYGVVSEADAKKELLKDVSAGADVFGFASDQTGELVSAGALYRVTKNKDQIVANNTAPSIQSATVDGELYGYPYVSDTYFMYYDKSKFTEEEVLSLDTMLAKDIPGTTTNFAFDTDNGWYQSSFFFGAGCKLFGDDGTDPTMCDFNNDRGMLAGEYLIDLVKNPKYGANFDDGLIKAGFADGSIAAAVTGTWNATDIQASLGDNYAATKLPSIKLSNGEEVQLGGMANFKIMGVNAETKNPLDAMALAEWLTNYDNQVINFEERSLAPTNVELANDTEKLYSNAAVAALAQQAQHATVQTSIPQCGNYWTPAEAFGQDLIAGNITRDNLQEKLDKYVESVLSALTSE
ncbi:MAG: extracellular solute-binding protein [Oscillospiraceae bacterium]|nr:extracellular solute-binding protein [Oscillospiraceae bacterium]